MGISSFSSKAINKTSVNYTTAGESYIGVLTFIATTNIIITISTTDITNAGGMLTVKDEENNANNRTITILGEAGQLINNQSAVGITSPGGSLIFYFDGSGKIFTINNVYESLSRSESKFNFNDLNITKDLVTFENALTVSWDGVNHQFQLKNIDLGTINAYYNGEFIINKSRYPISTGTPPISVTPGGVYLSDDGTLNTTYNMDLQGDGNGTFLINYILNTQKRRLLLQPGMRVSASGGPSFVGFYYWEAFI